METTIVYWGDIGIMEKKMENYYGRDHAVDPVAQISGRSCTSWAAASHLQTRFCLCLPESLKVPRITISAADGCRLCSLQLLAFVSWYAAHRADLDDLSCPST